MGIKYVLCDPSVSQPKSLKFDDNSLLEHHLIESLQRKTDTFTLTAINSSVDDSIATRIPEFFTGVIPIIMFFELSKNINPRMSYGSPKYF